MPATTYTHSTIHLDPGVELANAKIAHDVDGTLHSLTITVGGQYVTVFGERSQLRHIAVKFSDSLRKALNEIMESEAKANA